MVGPSEPHGGQGREPYAFAWRGLATLVTAVTSVGTSLVFLVVAWIIATFNCEDGCPSGSQWAPGASGSEIELWALAVPAVLASCFLTGAVARRRGRPALASWAALTALLISWCIFTGVSRASIDFSGSNSHWMWLAGLLVASGGGGIGVAVIFAADRRRDPTTTAATGHGPPE